MVPIKNKKLPWGLPIRVRISLAVFCAVVLSQLISGYYTYQFLEGAEEKQITKSLSSLTKLISIQLKAENHYEIAKSLVDKNTVRPEVLIQEGRALIKRAGISNHLDGNIYTLLPLELTQGKFIIGLSDKMDPGMEFELRSAHLTQLLDKTIGDRIASRHSESGFLTVAAPLTAQDGKVTGFVIVDYPFYEAVQAVRTKFFTHLSLYCIAGVAVAFFIGLIVGHVFSRPIIELSEAARRVGDGNLEVRVRPKCKDELGKLMIVFNDMVEQIQDQRQKLQDYSTTLENKVDERTKELKDANVSITAMVESLGQGFFSFDSHGICQPIFSKACEQIIETKPTGKPIWEVLKVTETTGKQWVQTLFMPGLDISFEDIAKLGPEIYPHSQGHFVSLTHRPIKDEKGGSKR